MTGMYSLEDLEARYLKSVSVGPNQGISWAALLPEALGETMLLASPSVWWLRAFLALWLCHTAS